jgi:hypothetical protein
MIFSTLSRLPGSEVAKAINLRSLIARRVRISMIHAAGLVSGIRIGKQQLVEAFDHRDCDRSRRCHKKYHILYGKG